MKNFNYSQQLKQEMQNKNSGIALITIIIFIFTLAIMGITFLSMINVDVVEFNYQYQNIQSFYIAEAGISKTLWYLNKKENIPSGLEKLQITSDNKIRDIGSYKLEISGGNTKQIISIGYVKKERTKISIQAQDDPQTEITDFYFISGSWKREK